MQRRDSGRVSENMLKAELAGASERESKQKSNGGKGLVFGVRDSDRLTTEGKAVRRLLKNICFRKKLHIFKYILSYSRSHL